MYIFFYVMNMNKVCMNAMLSWLRSKGSRGYAVKVPCGSENFEKKICSIILEQNNNPLCPVAAASAHFALIPAVPSSSAFLFHQGK